MRQVDPNRPIKFMAPAGFGADRYLALARRWGGWPHFTGEVHGRRGERDREQERGEEQGAGHGGGKIVERIES